MRRKLLSLALMFVAMCGLAQDRMAMIVHLADQSTMQFLLAKQPAVSFSAGSLFVSFANDGETEPDGMEFKREEVLYVSFEEVTDRVEEAATPGSRITFDLRNGSKVCISGLQPSDHILVVAIDGKNIQVPVTYQDGEAIINLGQQPRGIYLVSVNQRFTFKLMKP